MLKTKILALGVIATHLVSFAGVCVAEDGVTSDTITIGQSAPLTGPAAMIGNAARAGALAYFEHVNRSGGMNGRKIVLETIDDGFQAERAADNTRTLIEKTKVFALFGYVGGPASSAGFPIATTAKVPFIGAMNGNDLLREPFNKYVFNVRASFSDEIGFVIDYLTTVGITRIAVVYPNDQMGKKALATAELALKKKGLQPTPAAAYERNSSRFTEIAALLAKSQSQASIVFSPPKVAAGIIRDTKKANLDPQFIGLSVIGASELVQELGADAWGVGISQVVPLPTSQTLPVISEYQKAMVRNGTKNFTHASLEGFIAAKVLVEGLRKAGHRLTRERFIEALETLYSYDVGGLIVNFSETNHSSSTFVELTVVGKGGAILR